MNIVKFAELAETSGVASITDKLGDEIIVISESIVSSNTFNEEVGDMLETDKSIEIIEVIELSVAIVTENDKLKIIVQYYMYFNITWSIK